TENDYLNDGFILEERKQLDPNNAAAGTVPFHRQYVTSAFNLQTANGRDHDNAMYAQDSWKPTARLTASYGLRVDFLRRFDVLRNLQRQSSVEVAPRLGFAYVLTAVAKNVRRGRSGRYRRQLLACPGAIAAFGRSDAAGV